MRNLERFWNQLQGSMKILEDATREVYSACKQESDVLRKSELRYLLRVLENAGGYNYSALCGHLEYVLSKDRNVGKLILKPNGRYALGRGQDEHEFSSGGPIELYIDKLDDDYDEPGWYFGRVEHRSGGYYFFSYQGEHLDLQQGMKAAVR